MNDIDEQCNKLIAQVLQGQATIRFNMVSECQTAWLLAVRAGMLDRHRTNLTAVGIPHTTYLVHQYQRYITGNSTAAKGFAIRCRSNHWVIFGSLRGGPDYEFKNHLFVNGISPENQIDCIKLVINIGDGEQPVWLYDPDNYFYPKV